MNMMVQRIAGSDAFPFGLIDLKAHLRIDFDDDDASLANMGKTAAAEIEQFAQIALLTQTIRGTIIDPDRDRILRLPVGPSIGESVPTITINDVAFTDFEFISGDRPVIFWKGDFPNLFLNLMEIEYQAGFGASETDIPSDLSQAVLDQAALHYDGRSPMNAKSLTTSPHMARVAARYRGVQL